MRFRWHIRSPFSTKMRDRGSLAWRYTRATSFSRAAGILGDAGLVGRAVGRRRAQVDEVGNGAVGAHASREWQMSTGHVDMRRVSKHAPHVVPADADACVKQRPDAARTAKRTGGHGCGRRAAVECVREPPWLDVSAISRYVNGPLSLPGVIVSSARVQWQATKRGADAADGGNKRARAQEGGGVGAYIKRTRANRKITTCCRRKCWCSAHGSAWRVARSTRRTASCVALRWDRTAASPAPSTCASCWCRSFCTKGGVSAPS